MLLGRTTAVVMLCVIIPRVHTTALVNLDILEMGDNAKVKFSIDSIIFISEVFGRFYAPREGRKGVVGVASELCYPQL